MKKRTVVKGSLLFLACYLIAGIPGVLTVVLMYWLSYQGFAVDSHEKHGISNQSASRLGGVAVLFGALSIYWLVIAMKFPISESVAKSAASSPIFWCALAIGTIGFIDDLTGGLAPLSRLLGALFIFSISLLLMPELVPRAVGVLGVDALMSWRPFAYLLTLLVCVAMLNATNMADGANGLMPLVFMGAFYAYMLIMGDLLYLAVSMSLLIFTLFNVLLGKLFLGDGGSYGLGALAALGAMQILSMGEASIWLILCLAAYPVIDFFVSCIRRIIAGRSPLSADSNHLHNQVYRFYRSFLSSALLANSASGLTISLLTTGVSLFLLGFWGIGSAYWMVLFAFFILLYIMAFWVLGIYRENHVS